MIELDALEFQTVLDDQVHVADVTIANLVNATRAAFAEGRESPAEDRFTALLTGLHVLPHEVHRILLRRLASAAGTPLDIATLTKLGVPEET